MIARIWKGAVRKHDGDAYAEYIEETGIRMAQRGVPIIALLTVALAAGAAAATPAGGAPASGHARAERYQTCMRVGDACGRRVEEGDVPYASFKDRSGRRPRVRVCVRDRDGRYCLPRRRPPRRHALLFQPVLYKNTGPQVTTWQIRGKVVGRWRWRVVPESE